MTDGENFARRQATQNLESSLFIFITRFDQKREELESLASQLYNDSFCDLIADIFERGLDEVRSIKAECDARASEEREYERSEKDCLWSDGCD